MHSSRWDRPLVIGHRGAPGYRPEHTESSYRLALELGADAVEPDIVATQDGILVVRHENEISATTDVAKHRRFARRKTTKVIDGIKHTGWFTEDFTWAELQELRAVERLKKLRSTNRDFDGVEPILRLSDVLRIVDEMSERQGRDFSIVIEIKHAHFYSTIGLSLDRLLLRELHDAGWAEKSDRLIIECFELGVLENLQQAGLHATYIFLLETAGSPADQVALHEAHARTFAWYRSDAGLDSLHERVHGVSVAKRDLFDTNSLGYALGTNDLVSRAHARGLAVFTWTLRPENFFLNPRFRTGLHPASWGDWRAESYQILCTGVDGIFVDHADLGVEVRNHFVAPDQGE